MIAGGGHSLGDKAYFLPEGLTADELGDHLAIRFGLKPAPEANSSTEPPPGPSEPEDDPEDFATIKRTYQSRYPYHWSKPLMDIAESFPEPVSDPSEMRQRYRLKLAGIFRQTRWLIKDLIVQSGEEIGKSTALSADALETQHEGFMEGKKGFACIAFGSRAQVKDKAEEFRTHGKPTTLIKTFWAHYEEVCEGFGVERIGLDEFEETSPGDVLLKIRIEQPEVFAELERIRQSLWSEAPFNTWTLLVMTHKAAALWQFSIFESRLASPGL